MQEIDFATMIREINNRMKYDCLQDVFPGTAYKYFKLKHPASCTGMEPERLL